MLELNLAKARELISATIDEVGEDYIYPFEGCVYALEPGSHAHYDSNVEVRIAEARPGCGVGIALNKGGVPTEALINTYSDASEALHSLSSRGYVNYSGAAETFLRTFQAKQDARYTFGDALVCAEEYLIRLQNEEGFEPSDEIRSYKN